MSSKAVIGVLAVQGCVEAHKDHIESCGAEFKAIRFAKDFDELDGIILPGGESSTQLRLLDVLDMRSRLVEAIKVLPTWGICAGSILLASSVTKPDQESFSMLDIQIERNGYGRQIASFNAKILDYECAFIRAPIIRESSDKVEILAKDHLSNPVFVRQKNCFASTFHPELNETKPSPFHKLFIETTLTSSKA